MSGAVKTQTIDSWLKAHARHQPSRAALHFEGKCWTYEAFSAWVEKLASGLQQELGLERGDRIAFYGKNSDTEIALFFAAARLGLIMVPLNWRLSPAEIAYILKDCGPKILFHDDAFSHAVPAVLEGLTDIAAINTSGGLADLLRSDPVVTDARFTDPLFIVYTSGTTGRPKGAVISQEAVFWNAVISVHAHEFVPTDHILNMLPLFHVGGINIQMMPCFFVGAQMTLHATFEPETTINALENEGITTTVCVPTVMRALLSQPGWDSLKLPHMRLFNTGSTDVPVEIIKANHARGIPMVQVYGATETGPIATYQKSGEAQATQGSIGRCGAHTQVKLMLDETHEAAVGENGEIWVKGPNNFSHYWNNPEATAAALVDGWFRTGDVAIQDENGLYWFADRVKHVIISGGENIYPAELERILNRIPGIREAAVVGRKHPKWGEVPVAAVVSDETGTTKDIVLAAFTDEIARFKRPKDVVFLNELPRNAMGKVLAAELRKMVAG